MICKFIGIKLTEKRVQKSDEIILFSWSTVLRLDLVSCGVVWCRVVYRILLREKKETDKISGDIDLRANIKIKAVRDRNPCARIKCAKFPITSRLKTKHVKYKSSLYVSRFVCLFVRFFSSNISSKFSYLIQCHKWRVFVVLKLRIGEDKDLACSVVSANEIV